MRATQLLHDLGQSLWLDNITRDLLNDGTLKRYIAEFSVTGLTSNPTIFDHAIKNGSSYDQAIRESAAKGENGEELFFELALEDITRAADLFRPVYDRTNGVDGWVSLEVSPLLAHDTASTLVKAKQLFACADRIIPELEASSAPEAETRQLNQQPNPPLQKIEESIMTTPALNKEQLDKMKTQPGFVAALDQSGGSTPKALVAYGIKDGAWSNEDEMFALVHQMRTRIITSPGFDGDRILGAILFENTMDREIKERPTADYLWNVKRVVPFLKVDKGLVEEKNGVRLMKPIPELAALLDKAKANRIFGTKMRSFIVQADSAGIKEIVDQQFEVAAQILAAGLVPIVEPEVSIHSPEKAKAEALLKTAILEKLNKLPADRLVLLKLTLPEQDDFYSDCVRHPNVVRVLALSGGYTREESNERLRRNPGVVASFSRALLEGLRVDQSDAEFDAELNAAIQSIFEASTVKRGSRKQTRRVQLRATV